ncbi:MAG: hypothetical protein HYV60_21480 [Planctomycetia bacterium]|nr:hypothetical protein [Planctomycetia bacterium]
MKLLQRGLFIGLFALALTTVAGLGMTVAANSPAKTADDCCCVVEDGQLVCTITGEVLEKCCCR